jgi:hypothetical protein
MYQTAAEFVFSRTSNGAACMGEGWSAPEERSAWSVGDESHLTVPVKPGEGDLMLEIAVTPFQLMPFARRQRLGISVNGVDFPEESVASETSIGIRLPAAQFGDCTYLAIRLRTPDSLCPAEVDHTQDRRKLGVALREVLVLRVPPEEPVKPRTLPPLQILDFQGSARDEGLVRGLTGLSSQALMMQMESLGHNSAWCSAAAARSPHACCASPALPIATCCWAWISGSKVWTTRLCYAAFWMATCSPNTWCATTATACISTPSCPNTRPRRMSSWQSRSRI